MMDLAPEEPPARSQAVRSVALAAAVTGLAGTVLWLRDGWTSWIAGPVFFLAAMGLIGALNDWVSDLLRLRAEGRRIASLIFLALFLFGGTSYILWVILSPGQCVDCDSPAGWALAAVFLVGGWGMAAVAVIQVFKGRPPSHHQEV